MIDMDMLIELNSSEAVEEKELELAIKKFSEYETLAIKHRLNHHVLRDEKQRLMENLKTLKGGYSGIRGYKLPSNSTELAESLIKRAEMLGKLENDALTEKIDDLREEQDDIKKQIESLISRAKQLGRNNRFEDINISIEFWGEAKVDVFTKKGEELDRAWAYLVGKKDNFLSSKNYITHLIQKLCKIAKKMSELEHRQKNEKQSDHIKYTGQAVIASNDDNKVFREIFLMGQYASNLNHIELQLSEDKKKHRSKKGAYSRSVWANELGLRLYIDFWIVGELPTESNVQKLYPDLLVGRQPKTIQNNFSFQRKKLFKIDSRVPEVDKKGRNKNINSHIPLWELNIVPA